MPNTIRPGGKYYDALSPRAMAESAARYHRQDKLPNRLKSTDAFATYTSTRFNDVDNFGAIKLADGSGKTLADKLKTAAVGDKDKTQALADVKAAIASALSLSAATTTAQTNFNRQMADINAGIKAKPPQYNITGIASSIQTFRTTAKQTLDAQHQLETQQLTQLFTNPDSDFVKKLAAVNGLTNQSQIDQLKDEMLKALKQSQQDEKKKFDETLETEVNDLHRRAETETLRLGYLHYLYNNSEGTRKEIDALAEARKKKRGTELANKQNATVDELFDDIKVSDLGQAPNHAYVRTPTGDKLVISRDEKGNTTNVVELPPYLFNFFYYKNPDGRLKHNLIAAANKTRAEGNDQIQTNIDFPRDEEFAMELGRQAYEAALAAGFDPTEPEDSKAKKNITITVNGKEKTAAELFEGQPSRLAAAKAAAAREQTQRRTYDKTPGIDAQSKFKETNQQQRHQLRQVLLDDASQNKPSSGFSR